MGLFAAIPAAIPAAPAAIPAAPAAIPAASAAIPAAMLTGAGAWRGNLHDIAVAVAALPVAVVPQGRCCHTASSFPPL